VGGEAKEQELNKYEVFNSGAKRSEYYNENGSLAIQEFAGIPHRFMNTTPITEGKNFVYYDLSVSYLKPIVAVNENGHITTLWFDSNYSFYRKTGKGPFMQQEIQVVYEVRPFTLPVEKTDSLGSFIDANGVKSSELVSEALELCVKDQDISEILGYVDKQQYVYKDGKLEDKVQVGRKEQAQKDTNAILLGIFGLLLALVIGRFVFRVNKGKKIRKFDPSKVEEEKPDFEVIVPLSENVSEIECVFGTFGFEETIVNTASERLTYAIKAQLESGISWKTILTRQLTEFDEWRKKHGESKISKYDVKVLVLKQLCYVAATKFKGSTSTFVPYLLDYALSMLEQGKPMNRIGPAIQAEEKTWFEFIKRWSVEDDKKVKGELITIENMNDLFKSAKFLRDYRSSRDD
jgi:hypothetical protein